MCGRYSITTPAEALRRLLEFSGPLPTLSRDDTRIHFPLTSQCYGGMGRVQLVAPNSLGQEGHVDADASRFVEKPERVDQGATPITTE